MTTPEIVFAGIVLVVGVPAMWKNMTAIGLVGSWVILQAAWLLTHVASVGLELVCDVAVIGVMLVKPDYEDGFPYRGMRHQLAAMFWTERTPCDRIIGAIFPLMWVLYAIDISDYYRWWGLWWLAAIQFVAAGVEPVRLALVRKWREKNNETPPRVLRVGSWGYA